MIRRTSVRTFDGDAGSEFYASFRCEDANSLRFISIAVIDKQTNRYVSEDAGPRFEFAWVPASVVGSEAGDQDVVNAALANPDHVPLRIVPRGQLAAAFLTDSGHPYPTLSIKGRPATLVARVEGIEPGTSGQITVAWS